MEEIPFTRAYLESLATGELIKMADILGLDILDNRERAFVVEELLDAYPLDPSFYDDDGSGDSAEKEITDIVLAEAAPLSKHYNISFIEVMIRDPLWAFVFWEIKASDDEQFEKNPDFNGYYLKISPLESSKNPSRNKNGERTSGEQTSDGVFTIPVRKGDTARYLGLTNAVGEGISWTEQCKCKVEFCASAGEIETVLAVSDPVILPGQPVLPLENQLARLSGYGDFQVIRKSERAPRVKGSASLNE